MSGNPTEPRRNRISAPSDRNQLWRELHPVRKAEGSQVGNVYFIPVTDFPIPELERERIKCFLSELKSQFIQLAGGSQFSLLGILNSVLEFEVLEKVGVNAFDWRPQIAMALFPDQPPPHLPGRAEATSWQNGFPVHEVMPMITYITKKDAVLQAYEELFGCGGTLLYLSLLNVDRFFEKTKEVFGYKITDQCFQLINCLPAFRLDTLLNATDRQFQALYSMTDLFISESIQDGGVIITASKSLDKVISNLARLLRPEEDINLR